MYVRFLLASACFGVLLCGSAQAEDITVVGHKGFGSANGPIGSQPGGGLIKEQKVPRSESTVSSDYIHRQAPGANAFDLISMLPGVNNSSMDVFGFSAQSDLSLRGLTSTSLGVVLEGMPLNDVSDFAAYPNQAADSENYKSLSLVQGGSDLGSPVINAAAGLMTLTLRDPGINFGAMLEGAYGSYNTNRAFMRIDTGEIGTTGLRGFVSYSHTEGNNWRGPGRDEKQHIDLKFVKDWGADNRIALVGMWNRALTSGYPDVTLGNWHLYGRGDANNYAATFGHDPNTQYNYWRLARAPFELFYSSMPVNLTLSDTVKFSMAPYLQWGHGNSPYGTTLRNSGLWQGQEPVPDILSGLPNTADGMTTVMKNYVQRTWRAGFAPTLEWEAGNHHLVFGYWYDYSDDAQIAPFSVLSDKGHPFDPWAESRQGTVILSDGRQLRARDIHTITQINALFIGDTVHLLDDRLLVSAGFKEVMVSRNGWNALSKTSYHTGTNTAEHLPRFSVLYRPNDHHQIFANVTTNFRTPSKHALYDTYDVKSGVASFAANTNLKNEYSIAEELGYRYSGPLVLGSVTFFNYNFTNRQIDTVVRPGVNSSINAGGQTSRGVDMEVGLRPWHHFSPYFSAEYLHTSIDNNIQAGNDLLPTKGKRAVRSPALLARMALTYDDGSLFGMVAVRYTHHQYATFMNDEKIPAFVTADMTLGYRLPDMGPARHPELRLNVINIADNKYLGGVSSPTLNAHTTTGIRGTRIAGSAPTYYIGGGIAAMASLSTGF